MYIGILTLSFKPLQKDKVSIQFRGKIMSGDLTKKGIT